MSHRFSTLLVLAGGLLIYPVQSPAAFGQGATNDVTSLFSSLPGKELVERLQDSNTCSRAFFELWRRANPGKQFDYDSFVECHYSPKVITCPQGSNEPPLYVVLYGFLSKVRHPPFGEDYCVNNPEELFKPFPSQGISGEWDEPAIEVFTSTGKRVEPFGGDNVLDKGGIIADINADGLMERASRTRCGVDGVKNVEILEVETVREKAEPIITIVYNWDDDEWFYRFSTPNKDGTINIELGPRTKDGIKTKAVFSWDHNKKTYVGPQGKDGDHFRVFDGQDIWKDLERLRKKRISFPRDPDFMKEPEGVVVRQESPRSGKKSSLSCVSKPYKYTSLKNMSNDEIVRYMGQGRDMHQLDREAIVKTHAPAKFWEQEPKAAALAMAEENRSGNHRGMYQLALDDRDGTRPPDTCSIAFTFNSDRSYNAIDEHYFLRIDPGKSYIAYARSWESGGVFYNFVYNQPAFDLRYCDLNYEEAKHLAHTIWWLDRVRSKSAPSAENSGFGWSSADGGAQLTFRDDGTNAATAISGTIWACQAVSERWRGNYSRDVLLNLVSFLFDLCLPERLGEKWSKFEPRHPQGILSRYTNAPKYDPAEESNLRMLTAKFMDMFSPDQRCISFAILGEAMRMAGRFGYADLSGKLEGIRKNLPKVEGPVRTVETIEEEIKKLDAVKPGSDDFRAAIGKRSQLYNELRVIRRGYRAGDVKRLEEIIDISLKRISIFNDMQALQDLACSRDAGSQWALQRLREKDTKRYVAALEWWLKNTKDKWVRQAFEAIAKTDPRAAELIAKKVPPDRKTDLSVSAFAHLAEVDGIPDEGKRIKAIIKVALDSKAGFQERGNAIDLLVPRDQPMRYAERVIDEALVRMLDPALADETVNFTLGHACRAIARRGRTEFFPDIRRALDKCKDGMIYAEILGSLTHLAQVDPGKFNCQIIDIIKPLFKTSQGNMTEILWDVWAGDLRELRHELDNCATSDPDDYEDRKASSYSSEASPVEGRFHIARKIVSIWNEEDNVTRLRLLLAFGLKNIGEGDLEPERTEQWRKQLAVEAAKLSPEQAGQVHSFIDWYKAQYIEKDGNVENRERRGKFVENVRTWLGVQAGSRGRVAGSDCE